MLAENLEPGRLATHIEDLEDEFRARVAESRADLVKAAAERSTAFWTHAAVLRRCARDQADLAWLLEARALWDRVRAERETAPQPKAARGIPEQG